MYISIFISFFSRNNLYDIDETYTQNIYKHPTYLQKYVQSIKHLHLEYLNVVDDLCYFLMRKMSTHIPLLLLKVSTLWFTYLL